MSKIELFGRVRIELKRAMRLFWDQLHTNYPTDHFYTILFEVAVCGTYVIRVAGSEESITHLAEKYVAKGYRTKSGDLLDNLRTFLRWDAPGDSRDGWYWGDQAEDMPMSQLLDNAVKEGNYREYDEALPLRTLCLDALRELDAERVFGRGTEREGILIGTCCCETGFPDDMGQLASLNPESTIRRLRQELQAASEVDALLVPYWARVG